MWWIWSQSVSGVGEVVDQLQLLSFPVAPLAGWFSSEVFEPTTKCQNSVCQKLFEGTKVPFEEEARQTAAVKAHRGGNKCWIWAAAVVVVWSPVWWRTECETEQCWPPESIEPGKAMAERNDLQPTLIPRDGCSPCWKGTHRLCC